MIVVRVFQKKTQATPSGEIALALRRDRTRLAESQGGEVDMGIRVDDLHKKWMKNPNYQREYAALAEEFALTRALIEARSRAGLTQAEVARRMKTTQAVIARLESGGSQPSTRTLERFAKATGNRLRILFEPESTVRRT